MQVTNNKEEVPFSYYAELYSKADKAEIAKRLGIHPENGAFFVALMGKTYTVAETAEITDGQGSNPALPVQTFLLRYLLEGKNIPAMGNWKTFREMPWGELYIKPYTGRVLTRAAFTFGTRVEAFRKAAEKMGAEAVPHGDAGFEFALIGDYKIRLLVWAGDEEFPPSAQVLYSDNFEEGFAPEDRVVAGDILITAIKANM
ncbi:MAG: DUF3786 domain-containing protein [Oscillospiraceae bacterium]|nr:DUF3786 domain-containing protein [Oscillospiraceae bacterium]